MRWAAAAVAALLLAACSGAGGGGAAAGQPEPRTLTVFAAASLTEAFGELETRFEEVHPGVDVVFGFGASSDLAQQVVHGAPAEVLATADPATMRTVADAGLVDGEPVVFATNVLQIATPSGNPAGIASFADLARPGLQVVVCAPQVPCGAAAERVERATGVALDPVSEEPDVESVLGKVVTRDADAGLVYASDVRAAGDDVAGIAFCEADLARTEYPIAVIADVPDADLARAFRSLVTGPSGRAVLGSAGFGRP